MQERTLASKPTKRIKNGKLALLKQISAKKDVAEGVSGTHV